MITAALWCLITGVLWTGVGVYFSVINRQGRDPVLFNLCAAVFLVIICAGTVKWSMLADAGWNIERFPALLCVMSIAGATMAAGMILMIVSMKLGMPDIAWSICQSSMVIPFSLGILINGDPFNIINLIGAFAITSGIVIFGRQKTTTIAHPVSNRWFVLAAAGFAVIGVSQYFFSLPSYWDGWTDTFKLRIPIQAGSGLLFFCILRPSGLCALDRMTWVHGAVFAVLTYAGRSSLYQTIDSLATVHMVSIAYPACLGLSILGFVIYHAISQRKISSLALSVACLLLAGLLMLGIR